jgi:TP901 family phage tail tape measure protein
MQAAGSFAMVGAASLGMAAIIGGAMGAAAMHFANFQSEMVRIRSETGESQKWVDQMSQSIIAMGGTVGYGPIPLAQALYRLASISTSLAPPFRTVAASEDMLTTSAKLAQIAHSDLEDTTNAIGQVMVNYGKQLGSASAAAGMLNTIVGEGDMRMNEWLGAMKNGIMPVASEAGVKFASLGAAIATLTDTGIPATRAATYLRSAILQIVQPSAAASTALQAIGLSGDDVAKRMGYFNQVLSDAGVTQTAVANELRKTGSLADTVQFLQTRLTSAGLSGQQAMALLSKAFGGIRSGTGMVGLVSNLNGLIQKEKDATEHGKNFSQVWGNFQKTDPAFKMKQLRASFDTATTALGQAFLPVLMKFLSVITPMIQNLANWVQHHQTLVMWLGIGLVIFLAVFGILMMLAAVFMVLAAGAAAVGLGLLPFIGIVAGIIIGVIALVAIIIYLITHWDDVKKKAGEIWGAISKAVGAFFSMIGTWVQGALKDIGGFFSSVGSWIQQHIKLFQILGAALLLLSGPVGWLALAAILIISHWKQITTFFGNLISGIGKFFSKLVGIGEKGWKEFSSRPMYWIGFLIGFLPIALFKLERNIYQWIARLIVNAAIGFANWVVAINNEINTLPGKIEAWLIDTWNRWVAWRDKMKADAGKKTREIVQNIITGISQLPGKVESFAKDMKTRFINWLFNMTINAGIEAGKLSVAIINELQKLPSQVFNLGVNIVQGLWNGIKSLAGWIKNQVGSFVSGLIDGMKAAAKIGSPSRLFADKIGMPIAQGISMGILQGQRGLNTTFQQVITGTIKTAPTGVPISVGRQNTTDTLLNALLQKLNEPRTITQAELEAALYKIVSGAKKSRIRMPQGA